MPRPTDPSLEERILNAAWELWKDGADKALTMRAVARAAGTNTPAVYRRFRCREDILRALLNRTRHRVFCQLESALSVQEACDRYLDFALSNPHEYELYYRGEYELLFAEARAGAATSNGILEQKRPALDLMKRKLAEQLGGTPDEYLRLTMALWALLHGTAMLLIAKTVLPQHRLEMRSICRISVTTFVKAAEAYGANNRREHIRLPS